MRAVQSSDAVTTSSPVELKAQLLTSSECPRNVVMRSPEYGSNINTEWQGGMWVKGPSVVKRREPSGLKTQVGPMLVQARTGSHMDQSGVRLRKGRTRVAS